MRRREFLQAAASEGDAPPAAGAGEGDAPGRPRRMPTLAIDASVVRWTQADPDSPARVGLGFACTRLS